MAKKDEKETISQEAAPPLEGKSARAEKPSKMIDVPVNVVGKFFGKDYVEVKDLAYNPENGNLSLHLSDTHTVVLNEYFQRKFMKVVLKQGKGEESAHRAPEFSKENAQGSAAKMKLRGERNGRLFVEPTGSVKWSGRHSGFILNIDQKHTVVIDGDRLFKRLGMQMVPLAMERQMAIAR